MKNLETQDTSRADYDGVTLSPPWGNIARHRMWRFSRGSVEMQSCKGTGNLDINDFVRERSIVHIEYIRQAETTKRWAMLIGCLCVTVSALVLVFAPDGRENISYLIGLALLVISGGAFGYGQLWFKSKHAEFGASSD